MGVGAEVLIVDWPRVEAVAVDGREELLHEAAFEETYRDDLAEHGWSWPTDPETPWCGRYALRDALGSYKPHFWAGHRWEQLRHSVEPELRGALDRFNDVLFWHRLRETTGTGSEIPQRPCAWEVDLLLWCPPDQVPTIADWWRYAAPRLESLREPFGEYVDAEAGGWLTTFESFAGFLADWGEVVTEAERRGWGIVVLRC